jgi:hypothetical protein
MGGNFKTRSKGIVNKSIDLSTFKLPDGHALMLRVSTKGTLESKYGFKWPELGPVECKDWDPRAECGNGLHGLLKAEGQSDHLRMYGEDPAWQVVMVELSTVVDLGGKIKVPRGVVIFTGDRVTAVALVQKHHPDAAANYGTATAGYRGTATAGEGGTATAGDRGTATAANYGTATAANYGTATAGEGGTATAGEGGVIVLYRYDRARNLYLPVVGIVGEDGILPKVPYKLDDGGKLVRKDGK